VAGLYQDREPKAAWLIARPALPAPFGHISRWEPSLLTVKRPGYERTPNFMLNYSVPSRRASCIEIAHEMVAFGFQLNTAIGHLQTRPTLERYKESGCAGMMKQNQSSPNSKGPMMTRQSSLSAYPVARGRAPLSPLQSRNIASRNSVAALGHIGQVPGHVHHRPSRGSDRRRPSRCRNSYSRGMARTCAQ